MFLYKGILRFSKENTGDIGTVFPFLLDIDPTGGRAKSTDYVPVAVGKIKMKIMIFQEWLTLFGNRKSLQWKTVFQKKSTEHKPCPKAFQTAFLAAQPGNGFFPFLPGTEIRKQCQSLLK